MVANVLSFAFATLVGVTFIAADAYIGTLRALDGFYSDADSSFLSEDAGARE